MRFKKRLSNAQQEFLRAVREGNLLMSELTAKFEVKQAQFARWMRSRPFRGALRGVLGEASVRGYVELQLAANVARAAMAAAVQNNTPIEEKLLAVFEKVLKLAWRERHEHEKRVRRIKRVRRGKPKVDPRRDLCHPRMKHREEELLAVLEK